MTSPAAESRTTLTSHRRIVAVLAGALLVASIAIPSNFAAAAPDYPTWDDVRKAQQDETAKKSEIDTLNALVVQLQTTADSLRATANEAASDYQIALEEAIVAEERAASLATQRGEAEATASSSAKEAGALFAKLGRSNTNDISLELLTSESGDIDRMLYKAGALSRFSDRAARIMSDAERDANLVTSLTEQAEVASGVLAEKRAVASEKLELANSAADAALAALQEQQTREVTLIEQLAFLKGTRAEVEAEYQKGVAARAAEAKARAEAAAAKAAADKAAADKAAADRAARNKPPAGGGGNGGGGGGGGGAVTPVAPTGSGSAGSYFVPSSQGWYRPVPGSVTSPYGPRKVICNSAGCSNNFHDGVDLAGSCGTAIKAVSGGTVVFVGNAGAFGNRVIIDHGNGIRSIYGHMSTGSFRVSNGQSIAAGTVIGGVGKTGVVTGCHLDIKISSGGTGINPSPFLSARGVYL